MRKAETREALLTDLLTYTQSYFDEVFGKEFMVSNHHKVICEHLEGVLTGEIKNLIINIPPRYSKTELAVISFMSWALAIQPKCEFIHSSYSANLATKNTSLTREVVTSSWYQDLFPYVQIDTNTRSKSDWKTTEGGRVYASGAGGSITGYGAGIKGLDTFGGAIIIDDPHKSVEAESENQRQTILDWYESTIKSRRNNGENTPIIVIMQRLHEGDLSGYLLEKYNKVFTHLCMPVIDENGEALCNNNHTLEEIKDLQQVSPYTFTGQYMQDPKPPEGKMFKREYWQFYDELPTFKDIYIITADTAMKTKEHNDFSVFQCWLKSGDSVYLIDQMRGKWEAPELRERLIDFYKIHNYSSTIYIEDKASGTGLIQELSNEIPIIGIPRNKDKFSRAQSVLPSLSKGKVLLPKNSDFTTGLILEFSAFSPLGTHKHDDQVDAAVDGISILLLGQESPPIFRVS